MRTPLIREFKKLYPNAKIIVIVDPIGKEVLQNNPDIYEIIVLNRSKKDIFKYLYGKIEIQIKMIMKSFDLIIDLYGGSSTYNMTKLSLSKYQIGFKSGKIWTNKNFIKNELEINFKNKYHLTNKLFEIFRYFDLKIDNLDTTPFIYTSTESEINIKQYVKSLECSSNYYLISLGSGGIEKILDMSLTFELIKYIYEKYNMIPAVILNPGQEYLQKQLINDFLIPNNIKHIKLKYLSIEDLAILMKLSDFIIVPDTGLYHMAVAIKIPIYSIFTYTNPKLVEPTSGIYKLVFEENKILKENENLELKFGTKNIDLFKLLRDFDNFYIKYEEKVYND
ncbi:glycosyltransferase family 9 protein [Aliarcobacter cryaerophilus]|uniref:glycosyltransferase family 9 protein n=1 Tax=Aliarcobacter cryaerophilus TaxID=28198 RepID=UPI0021B5552B|nr:glycosyltransferase family 9 protein [Aliarcobacter cryaerophilus]